MGHRVWHIPARRRADEDPALEPTGSGASMPYALSVATSAALVVRWWSGRPAAARSGPPAAGPPMGPYTSASEEG